MIEILQDHYFWIFMSIMAVGLLALAILQVIKKMQLKVKFRNIELDNQLEYKRKTDTIHINEAKLLLYELEEIDDKINQLKIEKELKIIDLIDRYEITSNNKSCDYIAERYVALYKAKGKAPEYNIRRSHEFCFFNMMLYEMDNKNRQIFMRLVRINGIHNMNRKEFDNYKKSHINEAMVNIKTTIKENYEKNILSLDYEEIEESLTNEDFAREIMADIDAMYEMAYYWANNTQKEIEKLKKRKAEIFTLAPKGE